MIELQDTRDGNPLSTAVDAFCDRPDDLYRESFKYFRTLFRSSQAEAREMQEIQLISYLPANVYRDRAALGAVITGAVLAIFAHLLEARLVDARYVAGAIVLASAETIAETKLCLASLPEEALHRLDEIILRQGILTGEGLRESDVVTRRVLDWLQHDLRKYQRWLRALGKNARIQHGLEPTPLGDPFLREVKARAVEQLRPVVVRWREWHGRQTVMPTQEEIARAFVREADRPEVPFFTDAHNRELWAAFVGENALELVELSAENLVHAFMGYVTQHDSDYVRQMISRK